MSTKNKKTSSSSTRSARKGRDTSRLKARQTPVSSVLVPEPEILEPSESNSLTSRFQDKSELLAWENELRFHVAENLIMLRKFRNLSQLALAKKAETSQPKVARVESGSENLTLNTLKRLIEAMDGRFHVSISPSELNFPAIPHWWHCIHSGAASLHRFHFKGMLLTDDGSSTGTIYSRWDTKLEPTQVTPELTESVTNWDVQSVGRLANV